MVARGNAAHDELEADQELGAVIMGGKLRGDLMGERMRRRIAMR